MRSIIGHCLVVDELNYFNQKYPKLTPSPYYTTTPSPLALQSHPSSSQTPLILNSLRLILPLMVFGSSSIISISLGYLYGAATCLSYCSISRLVRNCLFYRAPIITGCPGRSPVLSASFTSV